MTIKLKKEKMIHKNQIWVSMHATLHKTPKQPLAFIASSALPGSVMLAVLQVHQTNVSNRVVL